MADFFDITKDSKKAFDGTKIMDTEYAKKINQYPTIFVSFASAKGGLKKTIKFIKLQLQNEYDRYSFIFESLTVFQKSVYNSIVESLLHFNDEDMSGIDNSLAFLTEKLNEYYGKKAILFIDEYDTPFIEAHIHGYYENIRNGLASLLHTALKDNDHLQYAMITGIQRVAKESIFSDLNNLKVFTVADKQYSQYFGFTESETKAILEYYDLELNDGVKHMYDGYLYGGQEIYTLRAGSPILGLS